jgi:hypothetical protein
MRQRVVPNLSSRFASVKVDFHSKWIIQRIKVDFFQHLGGTVSEGKTFCNMSA